MRQWRKAALFLAGTGAVVQGVFAACVDHAIFDHVLKANVDPNGYVDYDSIRVNKGGDLYQYISFLEQADLSKCSEAERTAFWINAYNAHMIRLVLARPQLRSVSDDFKLFGEKFKVAKQNLSLNDIEHRVLRLDPKKGGPIPGLSIQKFDPRIHFALAFGAVDCGRLMNHAYQGVTLEDALQADSVNFANAPKHLRIDGDQLVMSSILHWYQEDFDSLGGVPNFLAGLTDPKLRPDADAVDAKLATDFPEKTRFRFDWTLNSIRNRPAAVPTPVPVTKP